MKDCSLKICLGCSECKKITINAKGWWHPESIEKCFNIEKGMNYGPSDNCILKFEHLVLDKRAGFKFNYLDDYIELYEYLRENNISIKNPFGRYFFIVSGSFFYEENNYLVFLIATIICTNFNTDQFLCFIIKNLIKRKYSL